MGKLRLSAADLRDEIAEALESTIDLYRSAKAERDSTDIVSGPVTDEEIDDFLFANPLFDLELARELLEPGLLGFHTKMASVPVDCPASGPMGLIEAFA